MDIHIHVEEQMAAITLPVIEKGNIAMPAERQLTPEEREQKVFERLGTYPALPRGFFSYFLIGKGHEIEAALKSLMRKGLIKSRVVRTGRDIVEMYYRVDRAQLVDAFFDLIQ